jgi:hypothetical protein
VAGFGIRLPQCCSGGKITRKEKTVEKGMNGSFCLLVRHLDRFSSYLMTLFQLKGPPSLLCNGYWGLFPCE